MSHGDDNRAFLLEGWLKGAGMVIVLLVWELVMLVTLLTAREPGGKAVTGMLLLLTPIGAVLFYGHRRAKRAAFERQLRKLLLASADPDPILVFYEELMLDPRVKVPHVDVFYTLGGAIILSLYGEHERAIAAVKAVDWRDRPPIIGAARWAAEAVHHFFGTRDFHLALSAALRGKAMSDPCGDFPGAKTSAKAWDSWVDAGRLLTDEPDADECQARLEERLRDKPMVMLEVFILWTLATAYAQRGDLLRAEEFERRYRRVAPHCVPIE